jgi:tungstate transport system substrate-binding protein
MQKRSLSNWIGLLALAVILLAACSPAATPLPTDAPTQPPAATTAPSATLPAPADMILATTTSTQDSGLLDYLLPDFEKEFNVKIKVVAVGSGQALQLGVDGNADVLLVHSPAAEKDFMDKRNGLRREDVMFNDFVVLGPETDPAKIAGMKTAAEALKAIAAAKAPFVSRGDNSGTYTKEVGIWKAAAIDPQGDWYIKAGEGMGAVLTMSDEKSAYTLSDRATYLTQSQKGLKLKILVEGEKGLLNPYGVIAVDPAKSPKIRNDLANQFIDWLVSLPTQEKIAAFKKDVFGISIFTPSAKAWKEAHP